ncbi:MAG: hypothetical protein HC912_06045 [Saprospiraceae bacterium]|nr:hypothetical protein [Saprospiraceae bacterium]
MKKLYIFLLGLCLCAAASGQIRITPAHPVVDSTITITFDATKGNKALANFTGEVYCHTGILIDKSVNNEWQRIQGKWGRSGRAGEDDERRRGVI